jgi:hypothetical protein
MGRTFIRQDTQIKPSDVYSDSIVAAEATYETNPANAEDNFNHLRSRLQEFLNRDGASFPTGDWWGALVAPSTLEAGILRGINAINDDLHLVEKKRILRDVHNLVDVAVPASVQATGTLTSAGAFTDTETVTIGSRTYTFRTPFVDAADNIDASGSVAQTHENLRRAINGDGVAGTNYGTGTAVHADVTAADTATTNVITAKKGGTQGNAIVTTETGTNISFGAATLTGGAGDVVILGTGELPSQLTAAVGAVTSLGTVVVTHGGTFGQHDLTELSGPNDLNPKNLVAIFDGTTRDPILDASDRQIWGLLQGESGLTDGTTITDTTTTRVQFSFVVVNSTGDDLVAVDGADIGGQTINYCFRERVRFEDLTEADFLKGAIVDTPGSATSVDRQNVYDNQGTTPVDVTTNSTLDLEGPGLEWLIRDDLEAILFRVLEGSAGGTSEIQFGSDVDVFNNDAVDNDFANGATINSGGTRPIAIGETDGVIASTAGDLRVFGTGELLLDDGNFTAEGTWAQAGVKVTEDTTEITTYETNFGGEVSLFNAINQAYAQSTARRKVVAVVTTTAAADADVSGPSNDNNIDADLGDLSAGTFVTDYDIYLNGVLLRNGADASANHDVYPGTSLANGQLKFEFTVKSTGSQPDQITVIDWAA